MRRLAIFTSVLMVAMFILSDGCKKEDKGLNKITIAGNINSDLNRDYFPESGIYLASYLTGCTETIYHSFFSVNFSEGPRLNFTIFHPTTSATIPEGTIQAQTGTECAQGFYAYLYTGQVIVTAYYINGGSIKITINGDIYNVDVNLIIDAQSGGGTITGNFNGPLTAGDSR